MSDEKSPPEVLSVGEMRRKYYHPNEQAPAIRLNPENVPQSLKHLIPVAERWGISDDMLRIDAVRKADLTEVDDLKRIVRENDDLLDQWLAGSEAQLRTPSAEYLAFTHMRMAADGC